MQSGAQIGSGANIMRRQVSAEPFPKRYFMRRALLPTPVQPVLLLGEPLRYRIALF